MLYGTPLLKPRGRCSNLLLELRHGVEAHPYGGDEDKGDGEQGEDLKNMFYLASFNIYKGIDRQRTILRLIH